MLKREIKNRGDRAGGDQVTKKTIQEELKTEEARVKMRGDLNRKTREEERKDAKPEVKVKLPRLEIIKFKGNHLDWTRFWTQFETEID